MYSKTSQTANKKTREYKKKKLPTRKTLIRELDNEVRRIVRERDDGCLICGSTKEEIGFFSRENYNGFQVGHYEDRGIYALRWDLKNVNGSCGFCNNRHRRHKLYYTAVIAEKYGNEVFREFLNKREQGSPSIVEMRELLALLITYKDK